MKMKRAFIAAPLIGTIIFLAAIALVINLEKTEAAEVARISSDAYHNRVVSLLEIYRNDLASIFRDSISSTIQNFILNPGWANLGFTDEKFSGAGVYYSYKDMRKNRCEAIKSISNEVICSLSVETSNRVGGTSDLKNAYKYGIPQWMSVATSPTVFEGMSFSPTNYDQAMVFLPKERADRTLGTSKEISYVDAVKDYRITCSKILSADSNLFDCDNFANNEGTAALQCKDGNQIISGCNSGIFIVRLKVLNPETYALLPRLTGTDSFGNEIRSGAIGDEDIYLPINVRIFYYDDLALQAYKYLAYGSTGTTPNRNAGPNAGVASGLCNGGTACRNVVENNLVTNNLLGYRSSGTFSSSEEAAQKLKETLATTLHSGLLRIMPTSQRDLAFGYAPSGSDDCNFFYDPTVGHTAFNPVEYSNAMSSVVTRDGPPPFAFYSSFQQTFCIKDANSAYRARSDEPFNIARYVTSIKYEGG